MNVILILLDTLRRDHIGCYGNPWIRTPHLDRLAAMGTRFTNAYCGSAPCMPARRELWTGRYEFPWRGWGPLEQDDPRLPLLLAQGRPPFGRPLEGSRRTMLITDHYHYWHFGAGNYHDGFAGYEFIRGQEHDPWQTDSTDMRPYPAPPQRLRSGIECHLRNTAHFRCEEDYFAPQVFSRAMRWLERNARLGEFFLLVESFDPHEPWDPPYPYAEMYNPGYQGDCITFPHYGTADQMSPEELCQMRALYAGEVTMVDRWLGLFLDKAEALGLLDNTCIIVATDHGHMLGEHNTVGKPTGSLGELWQEMAHVPLVIYHPEIARGVCDALVQTVDLLPTILEAAGVPLPPNLHGHSLLGLMRGQVSQVREYAFWAYFGHAVNVTDGRWVLFHWPTNEANRSLHWFSPLHPEFWQRQWPRERCGDHWLLHPAEGFCNPSQLYDLATDYAQEHNVIARHPAEADRLRAAIAGFFERVGAPQETRARYGL